MASSTAAASCATSCCRASANGERVTVAGLVLVRQRPGTAKGVIFMTLEDETGIANTIVWARAFETYRPVVIGARLVAVTGPLQSASGVIHVVMEHIEDLTPLLRRLSEEHGVRRRRSRMPTRRAARSSSAIAIRAPGIRW